MILKELEHSKLVNEIMEMKEQMKKSLMVSFKMAKWNYEKEKFEGDESKAEVWRQIMIASCENSDNHEFEDIFDGDEYKGCICLNCTANSAKDEHYESKFLFETNCETCEFKCSDPHEVSCEHPKLDDLDEVERAEWMNKYFEDSKNCPFWQGKL